jgi:hypothetical protein
MLGTGLPVSMYTTKTLIDMWRFNVPQLSEFLTFSAKDNVIKLLYLYQRLQCTDNYFFKIKFVFFLYLFICQHHEKGKRSVLIYFCYRTQWGTEHQYLFSRFLGVSILQLLIIYHIYGYDMLTLLQ